jgi:hypothetical protein
MREARDDLTCLSPSGEQPLIYTTVGIKSEATLMFAAWKQPENVQEAESVILLCILFL